MECILRQYYLVIIFVTVHDIRICLTQIFFVSFGEQDSVATCDKHVSKGIEPRDEYDVDVIGE